MRGWLALAALTWGCSNLQPIDPNRCGNRIVEEGEACDEGPDDTATCTDECRLICVGAEVGPASYVDNPEDAVPGGYCPPGYACGIDGLCSAPSGRFRAETSFEFDVEQADVGDLDGDGVADLVGIGATAIRIHLGDADGAPLSAISTLPSPSATGPFLLADLDASGGDDLFVPAEGGVVPFYATEAGTLEHRPSPTLLVPREGNLAAVDGVVTQANGPRQPLLVFAEAEGNFVVLRDLTTTGNPELARCDTGSPATMRRGQLAVAATGAGDLIAIGVDRTIDAGVCVLAPADPRQPGDPGWAPRFYKLAAGARFDVDSVPLLWVHLDADACPELLAPTLSGLDTQGHTTLRSTSACTFATAAVAAPSWPAARRVLGVGNLDRVGSDELVTSTGVFRVDSPTAVTGLGPPLAFERLRVADFNGDGVPDIAGVEFPASGEVGKEAVRILRTAGSPGTWQATAVVVETLRPVAQLAVGDFDGDLIDDLAITEISALSAQRVPTAMAVVVIYGQRSEIPEYHVLLETAPVVIATLGRRRGSAADGDAADDLGVALLGTTAKVPASVLYGSAQRSLTAPLASASGASVAAIAAGAWANDDELLDLVVYADTSQYVWPQVDEGFVTTGAGIASSVDARGLRDFAIASTTTASGGDTIVSVSTSKHRVAVGGVGACPGSWTTTDLPSLGASPAAQPRDLDGLPGDELLVTSAPATSTQAIYLFGAIDGACGLGASLLPAGHPLLGCDAAAILEASSTQAGDPRQREILAICRPSGGGAGQLRRFERVGDDYVATPLPVQLPGRARRLMVADFTGDGLEDALSITSVGPVDYATLLVQCAQTDESCR
ncbi:MAG: VCBS repeat-containing protein [Kofleriaceae bacterium]